VGEHRTQETLHAFSDRLGDDCIAGRRFTCTDQWEAYLTVIRKARRSLPAYHRSLPHHRSPEQSHRQNRSSEDLSMRGKGQLLKHSRWAILRRPENRTDKDELNSSNILPRLVGAER
jgi:transposase